MNRRTYLAVAATGVVGSVAGCAEVGDSRAFPPYPDSNTTELAGEGPATSEQFELTLDGPTLIDLEHTGSDAFTVVLDHPPDEETAGDGDEETEVDGNETTDANGNETSDPNDNETTDTDGNETSDTEDDLEIDAGAGDQINPVTAVASAAGPYNGRTLQSVETGEYVLHVIDADGDWEATVYDLPAYDDGVGIELPIELDGAQYDVIGPINFGEATTVDFEFSSTSEGGHQLFLTDRTGTDSHTVTQLDGEDSAAVSGDISGIGYLEVLTTADWSLAVSYTDSQES